VPPSLLGCTQNAAPHQPPAPRARTGHPCTLEAAAASPAPGAATPRRASRRMISSSSCNFGYVGSSNCKG